ncbi:winged helix-turn-helix transcriptional regulator [Sediminicola luteus]|uniref:Transcriptional regulator n=1 Tax=Sediminicola luteus TaxID=319238 RepID=A0A2A4GDX0_9FLAO|nr:helix-turn-helix domain-containing protein [Sediminicola luteus]PCE66611.1 transcriptional regulator [Sediminicola luteus]
MKKMTDHFSVSECTKEILAISDTMELLSGKWKIQIIGNLLYLGTMRFMELKRSLGAIGAKKLSNDLHELEINQLVTRTVKNTKPITVEYEATPYAQTLKPLINEISNWGKMHRKTITQNQKA